MRIGIADRGEADARHIDIANLLVDLVGVCRVGLRRVAECRECNQILSAVNKVWIANGTIATAPLTANSLAIYGTGEVDVKVVVLVTSNIYIVRLVGVDRLVGCNLNITLCLARCKHHIDRLCSINRRGDCIRCCNRYGYIFLALAI